MFSIVLFEPEIPPNTGNIIRLCANTGCSLHLIEPLGFELGEKQLRRAGLDYSDMTRLYVWEDWDALVRSGEIARWVTLSTRHQKHYSDFCFRAGDGLVFGSEGRGLPDSIRNGVPKSQRLTLPMQPNNRSLNLSNSVAVVVYEGWRQLGFV